MELTKPLGVVLGGDRGKTFFLKNKAVGPSIYLLNPYYTQDAGPSWHLLTPCYTQDASAIYLSHSSFLPTYVTIFYLFNPHNKLLKWELSLAPPAPPFQVRKLRPRVSTLLAQSKQEGTEPGRNPAV